MSQTFPSAVEELAGVAGVQVDWVDAWGTPRRVATDDLVAVLESVTGRSLDGVGSVAAASEDIANTRPVVEPVVVAWDGLLPKVAVPSSANTAEILLESGVTVRCAVDHGVVTGSDQLPIGYHRLVVDDGAATAWVFSAPRAVAPAPSHALGVMAPTYSLRSSVRDLGIGGVSELGRFAAMCDSGSVDIVGTLPIVAGFADEPSPYAPASRRAWNELYADLGALPGWDEPPPRGVARSADLVDHGAAGALVRSYLERYVRHVSSTDQLRSRVEGYLASNPEAVRYARFRATVDSVGRDWRRWGPDAGPDPDATAYHETVQWLMDLQLRGLSDTLAARGQFLYLDLPIGCHPDGYDVWDDPGLFAQASLGAPPDTLFAGGQDWGLPATIPSRSRLEGHANFAKAIRHQLTAAGLLRIDHVMGLLRTWWVPLGAAAPNGAFVRQPVDELFAIVCIESFRAGVGVVGENLGTVPGEIRDAMAEHRLSGMAMVSPDLSPPGEADLVALSSHDTPTFVSWWDGEDIDDLADLGVFDDERVHRERAERAEARAAFEHRFSTTGPSATMAAINRWMAASPAAMVMLTCDDLLSEHRRQNVPGTYAERPNWRLRYSRTVESMGGDDAFTDQLRSLGQLRKPGRAH